MKKILLFLFFPSAVFADYWTQMANFPGVGREMAINFSIGNKGYVGGGGIGNYTDFYEYDYATNSWTQKANYPGLTPYLSASFSVGDKGYGCTGYTGSNEFFEYDTTLNTWTAKPDFPGSARWGAVGFSIGMKGYFTCGSGGALMNDLWEWDPLLNTWTQKTNLPGPARRQPVAFTIDGKGYVCTGNGNTGYLNDLWEYDPVTDSWLQKADLPAIGRQDAACFVICGKGYVGTGEGPMLNDFWQYDPVTNSWLQKAFFPGSPRDDCAYFSVGGRAFVGLGQGAGYPTDFWEYTPDSGSCFLTVAFAAPNHICPGTCTDFTNLSSNATNFLWSFPGANPNISTDQNPVNICYNTPGNYNVQLIASDATTSDTLLLLNYITVYPTPPPQGILQSGDTLFANQGASSYQWYYNGDSIPGATDYFYVASSSGDYNVVATDENDCEVEAVINDVVANTTPLSFGEGSGVRLFPNPVEDKCTIHNSQFMIETAIEISVYNVLGERVLIQESRGKIQEEIIDMSKFRSGLYYLEVNSGEKIYRTKFIKQ